MRIAVLVWLGSMAFPVVQATASSTEDSDVTSHTVSLPSGIVDGNLLVVFFAHDDATSTVTFPAGWTDLGGLGYTFGTLSAAYRFADGGEGASIAVTTTNARNSAHNAYRITGHSAGVGPEISAGATGDSVTPDPDSLNPLGDTKDYLWIAVEGHDQDTNTTALPTSYGPIVEAHSTGTNAHSCASAPRSLNAASEDPSSFTIQTSRDWGARTLVVYPIEQGPSVQDTATSLEDAANVTSHTVTLPSNISSGDLLLIMFSTDGAPTITWPSGANDDFTEFFTGANGTANKFAVAYRQANGSEPSTVEVATDGSQRSAHISYRITGHIDPATQAPEASTSATGSSTTPDPDSLTPTGGAKNFLWIAAHGADRDHSTTVTPTDYAGLLTTNGSGANSANVAGAERHINATSQDPGSFTISGTDTWVACTVAVHPSPLTPADRTPARRAGIPGRGGLFNEGMIAPRGLKLSRVYSAVLDDIPIFSTQTVIRVTAPSDAVLAILRGWCGHRIDTGVETSLFTVVLQRASTDGIGGTTITPRPLQTGTPAFGGTVVVATINTEPTLSGDPLNNESWKGRNGWIYIPMPEEWIFVPPGGRIVLKLLLGNVAPTSVNAGLIFAEIG